MPSTSSSPPTTSPSNSKQQGLEHYLTRYWNPSDRLQEFERIVPFAHAGLVGSNYQFSEYAFGKDKSNLSQEDIRRLMSALGVNDAWGVVKRTAGRLGALLTNSADAEFKNLAVNRHKAAHVAGYVVDHPAISSALPVAKGLAVGLDISMSVAIQRMNATISASNQTFPITNDSNIKLRFVERHRRRLTQWMVIRENIPRAIIVGTNPETLFSSSVIAARNAVESLVQKDGTGRPMNWVSVLD